MFKLAAVRSSIELFSKLFREGRLISFLSRRFGRSNPGRAVVAQIAGIELPILLQGNVTAVTDIAEKTRAGTVGNDHQCIGWNFLHLQFSLLRQNLNGRDYNERRSAMLRLRKPTRYPGGIGE